MLTRLDSLLCQQGEVKTRKMSTVWLDLPSGRKPSYVIGQIRSEMTQLDKSRPPVQNTVDLFQRVNLFREGKDNPLCISPSIPHRA